jgi:type IV pilus assembly protein PilW
MSARNLAARSSRARVMRGFTLIELMITIAVALFLLGGLARIVQNVRLTYGNQQAMAQLQDAQRFAMTVITDVVQAAGYMPQVQAGGYVPNTPTVAFPVAAPFATAGQTLFGTHPGGAVPDTLQVRYRTAINDQVILCDGSSNTATAPDQLYTNIFTVVPPAAGVPGYLACQVNTNAVSAAAPGVALAQGIQNLQVYYGVKRSVPLTVDYNVDTYLTADQMTVNDWQYVSSLKVQLTFTNPLAAQPGQQPTIVFERVIPVMGRAGIHT